jgi:hypothetical protein
MADDSLDNDGLNLANLDAERRREEIRKLKQKRGDDLTDEAIKNAFDISESTLRRDLEWIEEKKVKEVTEVDSELEVGSHILFFKDLLREAWENYRNVDLDEKPQIKRQFFDALVNIRNRILEIQWETGLIPKDYSQEWLTMDNFTDADSMDEIDMDELENMKDELNEEIEKLDELDELQDEFDD